MKAVVTNTVHIPHCWCSITNLLDFGTVSSGIENKRVIFFYVLLTVHLDIIVQRKTNLIHNLFLVYFVKLYMFRAYLSPLSAGTTVCIQHLVLVIIFR